MIKYFVNEEKKTVVAKFETTYVLTDKGVWEKYIANHICKTISKTKDGIDLCLNDKNIFYKFIEDAIKQNDSCYGIAKCADTDTFDVEKGKEIAKKRLLKKYYRTQERALLNIIHAMNSVQQVLFSDYHKSKNKAGKFAQEIYCS
jgi:nitrogenase subunit NifH